MSIIRIKRQNEEYFFNKLSGSDQRRVRRLADRILHQLTEAKDKYVSSLDEVS